MSIVRTGTRRRAAPAGFVASFVVILALSSAPVSAGSGACGPADDGGGPDGCACRGRGAHASPCGGAGHGARDETGRGPTSPRAGRRGLGAGHGHGRGPGPGRVGAVDDHHDVIQALLADHDRIRRRVRRIDGGVESVTTSDDPAVAERLREHVVQMKTRMEGGVPVRTWDPLFVELFRHHDAVRIEIETVPGGVRVTETSDDPEVRKLLVQHAERAVSEFVERGHARASQPTPLPDDYGSGDGGAEAGR